MIGMKVEHKSMEFALPVILLHSSEQLTLTFDDMSDQSKYLKYTFIHCTYDWKPTPTFQPFDYMNTFMEGEIFNYRTSANTIQFYTTYWLDFPNQDVGISKSGNYILYIYEDNNGSYTPILTYRFIVAEKLVEIAPKVEQSSNLATRYIKQEISFQINHTNFRINNPARNLKVVITQNARSDNMYIATTPTTILNNVLRYDRPDEIVFEGGSEFRVFNIRSLKSVLENMGRHVSVGGENHSYIQEDKERVHLAYEDRVDINGCYFIAADDGHTIENADYTNVHFSLKCTPPPDVDIYVYGELTNWALSPDAKLEFNEYRKRWEVSLYLKTGYYNYTYLALAKGKTEATFMYTEGNFWQTENRYTFLAYYQGDGLQYDRVIGYKQHFSFDRETPVKKLF
jgi:hypothetical protein